MKVIKNNYVNKEHINVDVQVPKTLKIKCDRCGSELEIVEEDTYIGAYGAAYVICPCCGEDSMVEELDGITLTKDNIDFPIHFHRTNKDLKGVKEISSDKIIKDIKKAIEYFRENKDEWHWYTSIGDTFLSVYRHPGDEDYFIVVAKDFYETNIPFELHDYE